MVNPKKSNAPSKKATSRCNSDTSTKAVGRIEYRISLSFNFNSPHSSRSLEGNPKDDQNGQNPYVNLRGEAVALIEGQENGGTEKIIPIWGEAIVINKRKVKLGEVIIEREELLKPGKLM